MNGLAFIEIGRVPPDLLSRLAEATASVLGGRYLVLPERIDPKFAYMPDRDQYNSTMLVTRLIEHKPDAGCRILGVTDFDLCIPILTFVFGEAQLGCCAGVVSLHRLHQEFYGLPPDAELLFQRAFKESLHELGHTFGLRHCPDYECVMCSSTGVEQIDIKQAAFCRTCRKAIDSAGHEDISLASP